MSISERMFCIMNEKGIRPIDLASFLNVGSGQISTWKKRNTDPPARLLPLICEFLGVSCHFLLTGQEETAPYFSSDDKEWLSLIHSLPRDAQLEFKGELKGYLKCLKDDSRS